MAAINSNSAPTSASSTTRSTRSPTRREPFTTTAPPPPATPAVLSIGSPTTPSASTPTPTAVVPLSSRHPRLLLPLLHPELRPSQQPRSTRRSGLASSRTTGTSRPDLTINAGLRYEYEFLPFPQQPNLAIDAGIQHNRRNQCLPRRSQQLGPRIGLSHGIPSDPAAAHRSGYGLFYGRLPGCDHPQRALRHSDAPHLRPRSGSLPHQLQMPAGREPGIRLRLRLSTTPPSAVTTTTSAMVFDRRFRLPMVQQGSLTVEREFGAGVVASATYLMNIDRQLPNSVDINIAPPRRQNIPTQGGTGAPGVRDGETFAVPSTRSASTQITAPSPTSSRTQTRTTTRLCSKPAAAFAAGLRVTRKLDMGQGHRRRTNSGATPRTNAQFDPFTSSTTKASRPQFPAQDPHQCGLGAARSAPASNSPNRRQRLEDRPALYRDRAAAPTASTSSAAHCSAEATRASMAPAAQSISPPSAETPCAYPIRPNRPSNQPGNPCHRTHPSSRQRRDLQPHQPHQLFRNHAASVSRWN